MSVEENLELASRLVGTVEKKDWNLIRSLYDRDATVKVTGTLGVASGVEDLIKGWKADAAIFPDAHREVLRKFGQGDLVCMEIRETGTHRGPLARAGQTHLPTGRRFDIRVCVILRMKEGRIAEMTLYYDPQEPFAQLGIA